MNERLHERFTLRIPHFAVTYRGETKSLLNVSFGGFGVASLASVGAATGNAEAIISAPGGFSHHFTVQPVHRTGSIKGYQILRHDREGLVHFHDIVKLLGIGARMREISGHSVSVKAGSRRTLFFGPEGASVDAQYDDGSDKPCRVSVEFPFRNRRGKIEWSESKTVATGSAHLRVAPALISVLDHPGANAIYRILLALITIPVFDLKPMSVSEKN